MQASLRQNRFDRPGPDRVQFLGKQASRGSQPAYEKLCEAYVRYAIVVANSFRWSELELDELEGAALLGLAIGMRRWTPSRSDDPSSFIRNHIEAELRKTIWKHSQTVRASRREYKLQHAADRVREELRQELKRPPKMEEIAESLAVSVERLRSVLERAPETAPLQTKQEDSRKNDGSLIHLLAQSAYDLPDTQLTERETERVLRRLLNQLTDRKAKILKMAAGIGYGRGVSDETIGQHLDISGVRVGQLRREALKRLYEWCENLNLSLA